VRTNLSRRLIVWVGLPALLLFGGVGWLAARRSFSRLVEQTEQYTRTLARYHAAEIELRLSRASKIPENLGLILESTHFESEKHLEDFLRQVVVRNPEIFGSCVAFEPQTFTAGKHFYAPYFFRAGGKVEFVQLGNPDYHYFRWEWYERPKREGHSIWTEPYFDDGGGNTMMTTYSVPFYRGEKLWGVATIDIAMSQLMMDTKELQVGQTGYTIIVSRLGKFLAYPDPSKIMKDNIQEVSPELGARMLSGKQGFVRTVEPLGRRPAWVSYTTVQSGEFALATVYPEKEVLAQAFHLQWELLTLGVAGLIAVFAALVLVARSISKPIAELAHAAKEIAAGNLNHELRVNARTSEVRELANAFRKMTRDLRMRMEELRYTTTVKERIEGELSAARSIQFSLVAKRFPAFPDRHEIDIHAIIKPARAVGGDFYDFFFIDRHCLCMLAADVAGKGVSAALFMAVSKTLVRANAALASCPADMLAKVNNELCEEGATSGMFVSLALALLDLRSGQVQVCIAGHPSPLRLSRAGGVESLMGDTGVALGAWRNTSYVTANYQLERGDTLVFFTDGVTEALDAQQRFYTADRLRDLLSGLADGPVERITRTVVQDVREFCGTHEQADDLTLLAVRWNGDGAFSPS
jgi:sigma-B regulation protein RsbU (phosphoserine phosphatase)